MLSESVTYIRVPQKYGQPKDGVEQGPTSLESYGVLSHLSKKKKVDIETISMPQGSRDTAKGLKNLEKVYSLNLELRDTIAKHYSHTRFVLNVGGDHSIGLGTVAGAVKASDKSTPNARVGVVWFDAHPDINTAESSPSGNIHGMPLACCVGIGPEKLNTVMTRKITPEDLFYVGIRSIDPGERSEIKVESVSNYTAEQVKKVGMKKVVEEIFKKFENYDYVHLSFDIDGIDPKYIIGTGTPVPNGVELEDAIYFMKEMGKMKNLHSADIVEYNPVIEEKVTGPNVMKCIDALFGI
ncbi:arginase, putative [Entamoeba invadens IP1]|uniref:Arginase n=1 Tax=Entamoeba invadens IP1 TaxID=370355 RepID=A0A0A1U1B6_ENTIV|nr:arginase, putative [Entamoeba invadens IP1]ELP87839.1 arginase, putative [Entamoeba invadens IP1]|eukprot:XP_004254610.1 arginase, putative [Entamoeba invadens IP1]